MYGLFVQYGLKKNLQVHVNFGIGTQHKLGR